jgi:hypothetical protein
MGYTKKEPLKKKTTPKSPREQRPKQPPLPQKMTFLPLQKFVSDGEPNCYKNVCFVGVLEKVFE